MSEQTKNITSLAPHLAHLKPQTFRLTQDFFKMPRHVELEREGEEFSWEFAYCQQQIVQKQKSTAQHWIKFLSSTQHFFISLIQDEIIEQIGVRPWCDYEHDSRTLAWIIAHEHLIQFMNTLFCNTLTVEALSDKSIITQQSNTVALTWTLEWKGRKSNGIMLLPSCLLGTLCLSHQWLNIPNKLPWKSIPFHFDIILWSQAMGIDKLKQFQLGDIMIIGGAQQSWSSLYIRPKSKTNTIKNSAYWLAKYGNNQLTIQEFKANGQPAIPLTLKDRDTMNKTDELNTPSLDTLPVELTFKIGQLELPFSKLQNLQAGYIFELPQKLDQFETAVLANGKCIAHGALVAVGDVLGVRITRFDSNGIQ